VLAKLYSILLMTRMDRWAEGRGLRAVGQAGFRAERGTPDNAFVLRHLIDSTAVRGAPLYCAFIDFSKAYDRVDRRLLWRCLTGLGVEGPALDTLAQMYDEVWLQVRAGGELGERFRSDVGVKQGCPLSPLLFGIYIDRLERFLASECPECGAQLAGVVVRALFYADDIVLTAGSPAQLQRMLDCLHRFCEASSMFVNMKKSQVVVFNRNFHRLGMGQLAFTFNGAPLEVVPSYKYLGIQFEELRPTKDAVQQSIAKARKVMVQVFGRSKGLGVHNLASLSHLFDAVVEPVLSYGCEVWGPDWVSRCIAGNFTACDAEREVHLPFMRRAMGVATTTPVVAMMNELGREPLMFHWLRMAAKLWNKALSRPADDYLHAALVENVSLAAERGCPISTRKRLWSWHFTACMTALDIPWCTEAGEPAKVPVADIARAMRTRWEKHEWAEVNRVTDREPDWLQEPSAVRAAPESFSRGFKKFTYARWFAIKYVKQESFAFHLHRKDHIRAVMQFRLGSFKWLNIQLGRCRRQPRRQRVCSCCRTDVEDEGHVLQCPMYADIWSRAGLFTAPQDGWTDSTIHAAFNYTNKEDCTKFAECLVQCMRRKNEAMLCPQ
jgi:hypothetical protein